ncbi:nitroreductase family protein [Fischerella sp. PCC 9605]|uniref:nitroreductase family protein n=1 Tax=Fischerella sp. PCC 9605 TaxID=1173024 RepID=UPI00047AE361|nr:nitroreductase family protein [Fischerella sp. PCC 9605]
MTEKIFFTSPDIFIIQNRLYAPSHYGSGKWVVFNAKTRKAFLAIGKDSFPEVVGLLALASNHPVSSSDLLNAGIPITEAQIHKLIECDLLRNSSTQHSNHSPTFIQHYQLANLDYPFLDYFDSQWRKNDLELMRQYACQGGPPPTITERITEKNKQFYELPTVSPQDLNPLQNENFKSQKLCLTTFSAILRFVFGPIGELSGGEFGPWLRKTSPSGGARHPTEGVVLLPYNYYTELPGGIYIYDVKRHALVELVGEYEKSLLDLLSKDVLGFLIRSRVERPMWRYRDIRSFRPVLLDAGHVVETLELLLGHWGVATRVVSPPTCVSHDFSWLKEPELAMVLAGHPESIDNVKLPLSKTPQVADEDNSGKHLTNPGMYITFEEGGLTGRVLWPEPRQIKIDFSDFNILTHCLPSTRGDRITTVEGILDAIPGATVANINKLCEGGALLPVEIGKEFYSGVNLWVRHGWYLSLLAHLEVRAASLQSADLCFGGGVAALQTVPPHDLVPSLMKRQTTRKFLSTSISRGALEKILFEASLKIVPESETLTRLFVNALKVEDLEPLIYQWNVQNKEFISLNKQLTRKEIRALTIGQPFVEAGAAAIWLQRELDLSNPARYELDILGLGQIGQRICLAATAQGLGVFMTPAVSDKAIFNEFGISKQVETVIYFFTIGYAGN